MVLFFRDDFDDREYDLDFLMDHNLMSPASILRMLRMSLYVRILSKGHHDIMSALFLARKRERSFISALQADLKFLADLGGVFEEFRGKSIAEWTSYICGHSRHFLSQACEALGSEGAIFRDTPPSKNNTPTQENTPFSCNDCPKCFKSFQLNSSS